MWSDGLRSNNAIIQISLKMISEVSKTQNVILTHHIQTVLLFRLTVKSQNLVTYEFHEQFFFFLIFQLQNPNLHSHKQIAQEKKGNINKYNY